MGNRKNILLVIMLLLYSNCGEGQRDVEEQEQLTNFVGYSSKYSVSSTKELFVCLSSSQETHLERIHISDTLTDKKVINLPVTAPTITHSPCKSYQGKGCDFSSKVELEEYNLPASLYKINFQTEEDLSKDIYINIKEKKGHNKKIAVIQPSMTWEAYNNIGGKSLYSTPYQEDQRVSRLRVRKGSQLPIKYFKFFKENNIETAFYDDYDLHHSNTILNGIELVILIGHSEYWTYEMRKNIETFVKKGGKLLILSGNTLWWKVRIEGDNLVVNKSAKINYNTDEHNSTGLWRDKLVNRPEESFIGLTFQGAGYPVKRKFPTYNKSFYNSFGMSKKEYKESNGMYVIDESHPIFHKTALENNDVFGKNIKIVDIELDGLPMNDDFSVNNSRFLLSNPNLKPLAYAWATRYGKVIKKSVVIAEMEYGSGKILHMGSIGWVNAIEHPNSTSIKILKNAIKYMQE